MDPFGSKSRLNTDSGKLEFYRLDSLAKHGRIDRLPYSIRILLEALVRNVDGRIVTGLEGADHVRIRPRSVKSRSPSNRPALSCRTLPACRRWST